VRQRIWRESSNLFEKKRTSLKTKRSNHKRSNIITLFTAITFFEPSQHISKSAFPEIFGLTYFFVNQTSGIRICRLLFFSYSHNLWHLQAPPISRRRIQIPPTPQAYFTVRETKTNRFYRRYSPYPFQYEPNNGTFTRFFTRSALFHVFVDFVAVIFVDDSLGAQSLVHISGSDSEGAFVADDHFGDFFQVFLQ